MKRSFVSALARVVAVAAPVCALALSAGGDAKADNDRGERGIQLSIALGAGQAVTGPLARLALTSRYVAGGWQYRVELTTPSGAMCAVAYATPADADRLKHDILDGRTASVSCASPIGSAAPLVVLINTTSPANGDALIVTSRAGG